MPIEFPQLVELTQKLCVLEDFGFTMPIQYRSGRIGSVIVSELASSTNPNSPTLDVDSFFLFWMYLGLDSDRKRDCV